MLSVAIIIIIAMNKFSSNYYFRHFCNVPVWCSMQWVVSHSAPNYRCTVSMVGLSNNNKGIIFRECVSLCCNRILRFVSIVICIWLYFIFGLIHIYVHTKCNLLREPQQQSKQTQKKGASDNCQWTKFDGNRFACYDLIVVQGPSQQQQQKALQK